MPLDNRPRYGGHGRFDDRLNFGVEGEDFAAAWARRLGFSVLPHQPCPPNGKGGPRILTPHHGELVAPDLPLWREGVPLLLEVKRKAAFTLHRATGAWVTGVEASYFEQYCRVWDVTGVRTFLGFVHDDDPAQLTLGGEVWQLAQRVHHQYPETGDSRMLYWDRRRLVNLAEHPAFALPDPNDGMCRDYEPPPEDEPDPESPAPTGKRPPPDFNFGG